MNSVLQQLQHWRFRERMVRLVWGGARLGAIAAAVLLFACLADWTIDRYSGSRFWRGILNQTVVFAGDPLSAGETPFWLRFLMTAVQVALAAWLVFPLLVRPWRRTPPIVVLAGKAEKAYPAFDHRLVTALQLNRPTAQTKGMSKVLIAEVTREAGELSARHDFLKLIDHRRLGWAALVLAPVLLIWIVFALVNAGLVGILLQRQALLNAEIPRRTHLKNVTQDVWPTGAEVVVRYEVTGAYDRDDTGVLRIVPEDQPEEFYVLQFEKEVAETGTATFAVKLPPASRDFSFQARLGDGRTKEPGRVAFEAPPQLAPEDPKNPPLVAYQVLPTYLGVAPDGAPYTRRTESSIRGDVVDALPQSKVVVEARFNKPIANARLIVVERAEGVRERDLAALSPYFVSEDRRNAEWGFPTTAKTIGYRIELTDDRTFTNPVPIRRGIRMWEDRPPVVDFMKESNRAPDPDDPKGQGPPSDYVWEMPLHKDGRILVIYRARSELGVREANLRYRVKARGVQDDLYPDWYRTVNHPRQDRDGLVFKPYRLTPGPDPVKNKLGDFVPDLGLFRFSYRGLSDLDRDRVNCGFYAQPSRDPANQPGELEAGGRINFEVAGLEKLIPDTSAANGVRSDKIEVGDTVEVYVEVFDKLVWHKLTASSLAELRKDKAPAAVLDKLKPMLDLSLTQEEFQEELRKYLGDAEAKQYGGQVERKALLDLRSRPAGYSREAKRKIIVTESEAALAIFQRDEERQKRADKLREIANDQINVFKEKKK